MKKWIIAITIIIIIAAALVFTLSRSSNSAVLPKPVPINTANQPTMGNKNTAVRIVAFEDLKCGNCKRYNLNLFPKIKKKFIDTGIAKYTIINLAFVPGSLPAANAARCLYAQKPEYFFRFVKYVYHHQPPETENWATFPTLMKYASQIKGVNQKKLSRCLLKRPYTKFIRNNLKIAEKAMKLIFHGQVATPVLFINGIVVKPRSLQRVTTIIDAVK